MTINIGFERDIKLLVESSWGTTPASALELFKVTGASFEPVLEFAQDDEINSTGREKDQQIVAKSAKGSLKFNVRFCELMHDIFQHTLGASAWTSISIAAATDIGFNAADNALSSTTTNFIDNSMTVGCIIKLSGDQLAANKGIAKVTALTAHKATLSSAWLDLTVEAPEDAVTIAGDYIRDGSTQKSFSGEDEYTKVTQFSTATGLTVRSLNINISNKAKITGAVDFFGKAHSLVQTTIGTGTETAASTNKPMLSGAGVDKFFIDNASTGVADISLAFNWTRELHPVEPVGEENPTDVGIGKLTHTLNADLLFEDETVHDYFSGQTSIAVDAVIKDEDSNYYAFSMFTTKLPAADIPDSPNDLVRVSASMKAFENTSRSAICQIAKIAA